MMWCSHEDEDGYDNTHSEPDEHFHGEHSRQEHSLIVAADMIRCTSLAVYFGVIGTLVVGAGLGLTKILLGPVLDVACGRLRPPCRGEPVARRCEVRASSSTAQWLGQCRVSNTEVGTVLSSTEWTNKRHKNNV